MLYLFAVCGDVVIVCLYERFSCSIVLLLYLHVHVYFELKVMTLKVEYILHNLIFFSIGVYLDISLLLVTFSVSWI